MLVLYLKCAQEKWEKIIIKNKNNKEKEIRTKFLFLFMWPIFSGKKKKRFWKCWTSGCETPHFNELCCLQFLAPNNSYCWLLLCKLSFEIFPSCLLKSLNERTFIVKSSDIACVKKEPNPVCMLEVRWNLV